MASMRSRSASAGCTIIAASTPSNAPLLGHQDLAAAALLGRRAEDQRPGRRASSASAAAARPAPRPAVAMTLCPQAWPMPGSASYSHSTAIVGTGRAGPAANAVSSP